jgi:hypothetical protein
MYDPRVGKFLSVDPLTSRYPCLSPYQFAENQPVWAVDLNGLERYIVTNFVNRNNEIVRTTIEGIRSSDTKQAVNLQLKNAHGRPLTSQDVYVIKQLSDNPPQGSNATVQGVGGKTSLSRDEQRALNHSVATGTDENTTSSSDVPFDKNISYEFIFDGKGKYTSSYFDQSKNEFFAGALNFYYHTIEGTDLVGGNYDGSGKSHIDLSPTGVSNDVNALAELVQDSKTMIEKENPKINNKDQLDHVVLTTTTNAAPLINLVAAGLQKKLGVPVTVVVDDTIRPNGKPPGEANVNVKTAVRSVGNPNDNKSN